MLIIREGLKANKFTSVCGKSPASSDGDVGQVGFIRGCDFGKVDMFSKCTYDKYEWGI